MRHRHPSAHHWAQTASVRFRRTNAKSERHPIQGVSGQCQEIDQRQEYGYGAARGTETGQCRDHLSLAERLCQRGEELCLGVQSGAEQLGQCLLHAGRQDCGVRGYAGCDSGRGIAGYRGHEIAHAVAKHSAEQMSKQKNQSILTSLGASILAVKAGQEAANMATSLASTGLTFLNAHYSRDNESEADHMGLIFAAMAGYDPNTAISFWQRMSQASSGSASTSILQSYLSSHPSDAKRVTDIQKWLPEAMKYYTGK